VKIIFKVSLEAVLVVTEWMGVFSMRRIERFKNIEAILKQFLRSSFISFGLKALLPQTEFWTDIQTWPP
jgi:hypothetical protein